MIERFGTLPDGRNVRRARLHNDALRVQVLTLGAIVQDLRLAGVAHPPTLGAPRLAPYLQPMAYFGAMVGRFTNLIDGARFRLDGHDHTLSRNCHGRNRLHVGLEGGVQKLWQIRDHATERLALVIADAEGGFSRRLDVELQITPDGPALGFEITSTTDCATPCSFPQHSFYRPDDSGDIGAHRQRIVANTYLQVGAVMILTGAPHTVVKTDFDFRAPRSMAGAEVGHNFCLSPDRVPLRPVPWLDSVHSGITIELATTEPELQVFTADTLPKGGVIGFDDVPRRHRAGTAGLARRTRPPAFLPEILRPDARYHQSTHVTLKGTAQIVLQLARVPCRPGSSCQRSNSPRRLRAKLGPPRPPRNGPQSGRSSWLRGLGLAGRIGASVPWPQCHGAARAPRAHG